MMTAHKITRKQYKANMVWIKAYLEALQTGAEVYLVSIRQSIWVQNELF